MAAGTTDVDGTFDINTLTCNECNSSIKEILLPSFKVKRTYSKNRKSYQN